MDRSRIYIAARGYLGTRFHPQGRLKGKGIDCVGIVLCVGQELGLRYADGRPIAASDYLDYSLFPTRGQMHFEAEKIFSSSPANGPANAAGAAAIHFDKILAGDILSIGEPRRPLEVHHLAIVSELPPMHGTAPGGLGLIHAYGSIRCVTEHTLDRRWLARIVRVYSYKDAA